jgi:hypothetical protein
MLSIELDKPKVRDMADRLRWAVEGTQLSHSQALEILSKTLGYRNWDTLSGILRRDTPVVNFETLAASYLDEPVTMYLSVYACDDFGDSPSWAAVTIDRAWLATLFRLQALCIEQRVDSTALALGPDEWASSETFRIRSETFEVSEAHWFFKGFPKHADYAVETRMIDTARMLEALKAKGKPAAADVKVGDEPELVWVKDVLLYDHEGNGDVTNFLNELVEYGPLDASYGAIFKK